jgi:hypothetical protein
MISTSVEPSPPSGEMPNSRSMKSMVFPCLLLAQIISASPQSAGAAF